MIFSVTMPRFVRIALLVLALGAMLGVAAASPAHVHQNSPGGGCDICFSAHFVSYATNFGVEVPAAPQTEQPVTLPGTVIAGYQLLSSHSSFTRGPPAWTSNCVSSTAA